MQETKLSATTNASDSPNKTADVALAEDKSSAAPAPAPANAQAQVPAPASEANSVKVSKLRPLFVISNTIQ